jgi:hypothetical protein
MAAITANQNLQLLKNYRAEWHLHVDNFFDTMSVVAGGQILTAARPGGPMGLTGQGMIPQRTSSARRRTRPSRARTVTAAAR